MLQLIMVWFIALQVLFLDQVSKNAWLALGLVVHFDWHRVFEVAATIAIAHIEVRAAVFGTAWAMTSSQSSVSRWGAVFTGLR